MTNFSIISVIVVIGICCIVASPTHIKVANRALIIAKSRVVVNIVRAALSHTVRCLHHPRRWPAFSARLVQVADVAPFVTRFADIVIGNRAIRTTCSAGTCIEIVFSGAQET